ncbi:hypothetical protein E3N88_06781 [Mikania micrantha]|uniref:DUF659 domain-containing protein n=1 Tax=Mikania micrantha TaxID=192012 RepID=A0A5N6PRR3_9ASTR|nr:hypothetical protein E3N88_06781 [Mikania micrantha]
MRSIQISLHVFEVNEASLNNPTSQRLLNLLMSNHGGLIKVNNKYGTLYLRIVDASDCIKNAHKIFKLLDEVVEEIGEDVVNQVVTDNAGAYKASGALLTDKRKGLYWTLCAAHCIDLMLEKIEELPQHKNALLKAKKVSNLIYNHQYVLSLAQNTLNKDILQLATTRFSTTFSAIQSFFESKEPLQHMFVSTEWRNCAWAKKADVVRLVDGEQTPAMGFIYEEMDECEEKFAKNLDNKVSSYKEIWDIIDKKMGAANAS